MRTTATRPLALAAATALLLAACGADEPSASPTTVPGAADGGELRAPLPVTVSADGSAATRSASDATGSFAGDEAGDAGLTEAEMGILPWFGGWEFEVDPSLPALPTQAIGYEFPAGAPLGEDAVRRIAAALGLDGELRAGTEAEGVRWYVGPDDGTAPSLVVLNDGPLSWYRSGAWALDPNRWDCEIGLVDPGEPVSDEPDAAEGDAAEGDVLVGEDAVAPEQCPEPEPPTGILSAQEAEAEARRVLAELGLDPAAHEFETWADDWSASVTAWPVSDGVRWPLAFGFGFGAEGSLDWANGYLADPIATGPYPLIDLDEALARLDRPMWSGMAVPEPALEVVVDEPVSDEPVSDDRVTDGAAEMVREIARLVDVRTELWWAGTPDGSVWLLPAYTFIDTEDRWHTVPAVTDEFLVVEEPIVLMDPPIAVDPDDVVVDLAELADVAGLTVEKAEAVLAERGLSLRIIRIDGVEQPATMDLVPTRVNVAVVDEVVTEVLSTG